MSTEAKQLHLFLEEFPPSKKQKVTNVSSVPKRSPFRYAGGKTWLIPTIRKWLPVNSQARLIEPFCGGGIVSLTVVAENRVNQAIMIEKDEDVAAAWKTILEHNDWLADRIMKFDMTIENVHSKKL